MFFNYDYFCGANATIEIDGMTVTEAAAISYSVNESKIPLYGYSSRHFDAVGSGQVLVQGTLVINYVHHDYLFKLIEIAKGLVSDLPALQAADNPALFRDPQLTQEMASQIVNNYSQETGLAEALKSAYWDIPQRSATSRIVRRHNLHDRMDGCDIKITFGERSVENGFNGKSNRILMDVFFTGSGSQIQIDENVILEEYTFFARDIMYMTNPLVPTITTDVGPESEMTVEYSQSESD